MKKNKKKQTCVTQRYVMQRRGFRCSKDKVQLGDQRRDGLDSFYWTHIAQHCGTLFIPPLRRRGGYTVLSLSSLLSVTNIFHHTFLSNHAS